MSFSIFGISVEPWVFLILVIGYFIWAFAIFRFALFSEFWPRVDGEIIRVWVENERDSDGDDYFVPKVRYRYTVAGVPYEGKRLTFRHLGWRNASKAHAAIRDLRAGARHRVYFHVRFPRWSVLQPGAGWSNYFVLLVLFVVAVCAAYAHVHGISRT